MTVRFADTSVLLYAISRDPAEQDQAQRANDILAGRDLALSAQVLQEFYVQATRASRPDAIGHRQAVLLASVTHEWACHRFGTSSVLRGAASAAGPASRRP